MTIVKPTKGDPDTLTVYHGLDVVVSIITFVCVCDIVNFCVINLRLLQAIACASCCLFKKCGTPYSIIYVVGTALNQMSFYTNYNV